jgi:diadenosine tetraphosphate (Ap4A) HIT family hydrolase
MGSPSERSSAMVDIFTSGEAGPLPRRPIDAAACERRSREGPCFVCETLAGNPDYPGHVVWTDDYSVALLARYNTLLGHTLVAPRAHREQVTGDFTLQEYLGLQRLVYQVGEALRRVLPTERLYIMSLGSQSGNRHVHWHVAPLPPGVPYEQQQFAAFSWDRGVLDQPEQELASLAERIGAQVERMRQEE